MKEYISLSIEFPGVDFNDYYVNCADVSKIHLAHLFTHENEIELRIFFDDKTCFDRKFAAWSKKIAWNKFGSFIKVSNERLNDRLRKIDLSDSKLCGFIKCTSFYHGNLQYFKIKLDTVKFYWNPVQEQQNTAEFYLNEAGFRVVEPYYLNLFEPDGTCNIIRKPGLNVFYTLEKSKFRPEFNMFFKDEKSNKVVTVVKEPKIQFEYTKPVTEEEAISYGERICHLISFYYHIRIDYSLCRIHLPEHTITIKKIQEKNFIDIRGTLDAFQNFWDLHQFLLSDWQMETMKNFKLLSKAIALFNQALLVDSNSEFLIRYNIVEICNKLKQKTEKFNFVLEEEEKEKKFNDALNLLLECIDLKEKEQFKIKWNSLKGKLDYRSMKSTLVEFMESQNLQPSEFPISVSKLKDLRDKITHGSIRKVDSEHLRKANQFLYRINGILILNLIGIKDWKLDTELT